MELKNQILFYFGEKYYDKKIYYSSDIKLNGMYENDSFFYGVSSDYAIEYNFGDVGLSKVSFSVTNIKINNYFIRGDIRTLNTDYGKPLEILISENIKIYFRPVIKNNTISKFIMVYPDNKENIMMRKIKLRFILEGIEK